MSKLVLLCSAARRDAAVAALAELGVVHVVPLVLPKGDDLEALRQEAELLREAERLLPKRAGVLPSGRAGLEVARLVVAAAATRVDRSARVRELHAERARIAPFGEFAPEQMRELASRGIRVRLYRLPKDAEPELPEGTALVPIRANAEARWCALVAIDEARIAGEEVPVPARGLRALDAEIAALQAEASRCDTTIAEAAGDRGAIARAEAEVAGQLRLHEAVAGMSVEQPVAALLGWVPTREAARVEAAARQAGWAVAFSEPSADEEVPTLLDSVRWARPIETVFRAIGILPGYREPDVGPVFLLFLSVFFAMLVGDAAYGALFLVLTLVGRAFLPAVPRPAWNLLLITSTATIVWGVLTGTYFGNAGAPALLAGAKVAWLDDAKHVMLLCFFLGALHLTVAHGWAALRARGTWQLVAQLGWIATTWTMFFVARFMVLGQDLPPGVVWLFCGGVLAIVLFMTPPKALRSEWFNHVMLPLSLVSNFVDVVSYLRLFAVGTAGLEVAKAFNGMAGAGSPFLGAVLLFFGHGLNVILSMMGVLVHGVRLNTLEFSAHLGVQWGGVPYRPLVSSAPAEPR